MTGSQTHSDLGRGCPSWGSSKRKSLAGGTELCTLGEEKSALCGCKSQVRAERGVKRDLGLVDDGKE